MVVLDFDENQINDKAVVKVLKQIDSHAVATNEKLSVLDDKLDTLSKAFPAGDIEGHKRYHQTMIDMLDERRKLRMAIQEKTISGLIWAGIVGISLAVWHEVSRILGK